MTVGPSNSSNDDSASRWSSPGEAHLRPDASHAPSSSERRTDEIDALLRQAEEALARFDAPGSGLPAGAHPLELQDFAALSPHGELNVIETRTPGELELTIELGRVRLRVEELNALRKGAIVPLSPMVGAPVDVFAGERLVARGEVLVLNGRFCVRVTETFLPETTE